MSRPGRSLKRSAFQRTLDDVFSEAPRTERPGEVDRKAIGQILRLDGCSVPRQIGGRSDNITAALSQFLVLGLELVRGPNRIATSAASPTISITSSVISEQE
ncbi:hypothetical protein [Phyllobacterium sophorae]|uniref:Uncharacterized protein n=1 Tax=Phyllobacterium sophorae TaxID=1520277 RepID=A0A2P7B6M2_9HYPH|nr:hypothetical protein [Phyllobacterium sophorae]PSH62114.1 hypothetical protein CU103_19915 [Phyllobacterium sophorae]